MQRCNLIQNYVNSMFPLIRMEDVLSSLHATASRVKIHRFCREQELSKILDKIAKAMYRNTGGRFFLPFLQLDSIPVLFSYVPGYNNVLYPTLMLSDGSGSVMCRGRFLAPCCFSSQARFHNYSWIPNPKFLCLWAWESHWFWCLGNLGTTRN